MRSRPHATGLIASGLLLVISVDNATAAGAVPPSSDLEDVSGRLTRNADEESLAINLINATDAELDGPGELIFLAAIFGDPLAVKEDDGFASTLVARAHGSTGEVSADFTAIPEGSATGSATAGMDFAARSGTLTWADGDDSPKRDNLISLSPSAISLVLRLMTAARWRSGRTWIVAGQASSSAVAGPLRRSSTAAELS